MITQRLNELKARGNYSWQELSDMTGIPVATIRKTFSGETVNPSFEVVSKLIAAMGGSLDDEKPTEGIKNTRAATEQIQCLYEARIADLKDTVAKLTAENKTLFHTLICTVGVLLALILYLFLDGMNGSWGLFRY